MRFSLSLLVSAVLALNFNLQAAEHKKLLVAKPIKSDTILTADDSIAQMNVSNAYVSGYPKAKGGQDLIGIEHDAIQTFIKDATPAAKKRLVLVRYENSDDRIVKDLLDAKAAGFKEVLFINDFNTSLDGIFEEKPNEKAESLHTDFADRAKYKPGPAGDALKKLIDGGFKYNDPTYGIYSQPLFNKKVNDRVPIMHEKELMLVTELGPGKREITLYSGTANMTNIHYNRHLQITDQAIAQQYLDHAYLLRDTFAKKGADARIAKVKSLTPIRIYYNDGTSALNAEEADQDRSYAELQFTDGNYNPNDRIADLLSASARKLLTINQVTFSEFVLTESDVVTNLRRAMEVDKGFKVFGVFDDKFIDIHAFGLAGELNGFPINRPMGHALLGFNSDLVERMELLAYQRQRRKDGVSVAEQDPDAEPTSRYLWHDKTTIVSLTDKHDKKWDYVFTGSFNNSNNSANAESQLEYRFPGGSAMAEAVKESIHKVAKGEMDTPPTGETVPTVFKLPQALVRNGIARFTGRAVFQVSPTIAHDIYEAMLTGDNTKLAEKAAPILKIKSTLSTKLKVSDAEIKKRFEILQSFAAWYKDLKMDKEFKQGDFLPAQKLVAAAIVLAYPRDSANRKRDALETILTTTALSDPKNQEKLTTLIEAAWKQLELPGEAPKPLPPKKPGTSDDKIDD